MGICGNSFFINKIFGKNQIINGNKANLLAKNYETYCKLLLNMCVIYFSSWRNIRRTKRSYFKKFFFILIIKISFILEMRLWILLEMKQILILQKLMIISIFICSKILNHWLFKFRIFKVHKQFWVINYVIYLKY